MIEPLWCNANYSRTTIKFKFDPSSKLNDVGATRPKEVQFRLVSFCCFVHALTCPEN